jgi:hypothetical protein
MKQTVGLAANLLIVAVLFSSHVLAQSTQAAPKTVVTSQTPDVNYPYQLFSTSNIWTQILLDTATGRAWQVQFSVGEDDSSGKWVINDSSLLPRGSNPRNGRFILYPTQNMYTFLLLDRQDSRIWQLQWSLDSANRGLVRKISQEE